MLGSIAEMTETFEGTITDGISPDRRLEVKRTLESSAGKQVFLLCLLV